MDWLYVFERYGNNCNNYDGVGPNLFFWFYSYLLEYLAEPFSRIHKGYIVSLKISMDEGKVITSYEEEFKKLWK